MSHSDGPFYAGQDEYQAHLKYESDPEYRKKMDEMHEQLFGDKKRNEAHPTPEPFEVARKE
ncbi:hypothetical protein Lepto7375DRAFT_7439 [Leptolyngbya sp. PCC 7375]|nr:hypothetical protein Lepto7375DRAFT_7439 [Leptolyngbya sp. PCC 7375]